MEGDEPKSKQRAFTPRTTFSLACCCGWKENPLSSFTPSVSMSQNTHTTDGSSFTHPKTYATLSLFLSLSLSLSPQHTLSRSLSLSLLHTDAYELLLQLLLLLLRRRRRRGELKEHWLFSDERGGNPLRPLTSTPKYRQNLSSAISNKSGNDFWLKSYLGRTAIWWSLYID